jgi:hypothetical protein
MTSKNTVNQYTPAKWRAAKKEARAELIQRAKQKKMITYSALCNSVTSIHFTPDDAALHQLLGEISGDENGDGRGMLTAIVVLKGGDNPDTPGGGFYACAKNLGYNVKPGDVEKLAFWAEQVKAVFSFWTTHPNQS